MRPVAIGIAEPMPGTRESLVNITSAAYRFLMASKILQATLRLQTLVGCSVGTRVGNLLGNPVGILLGISVGFCVGT